MAEKQAKASSDVKSGKENKAFARETLGGFPSEKEVKEINKVNTPGKAPGSVRHTRSGG